MSRSLKKGPFTDSKLMHKVITLKGKNKSIKTWSRRSVITPEMLEMDFEVHNGKTFIPVRVRETMIGHKLGEFAPTRKFVKHSSKKV
jgi:small subunit ribosomal protein S19